ncbi:hypothetical protein FOZ60_009894 [Perkinsus olseni]|uniref:U1-type domain-containing protein n=1 Tax=Perkinsus olseni TaxID=32597 RepID=A0A7J6PMN6_PEROL|nr:hypothetical protein FOZ60_009894 [Perkinsus olseni]
MLRRGNSSSSTHHHQPTIALTKVSLCAVHMFLTALAEQGFFQSTVDQQFLVWRASDECRGKLEVLARPEQENYQKVAAVEVTAKDWEGPIERDALATILVYLSSGLNVSNCVDVAVRARRDPKVGGYLGLRPPKVISRRAKVERRERRAFPTVRTVEVERWRDAIEADILAATAEFGGVKPIWCPLCLTLCDRVSMFAEHVVSDSHRRNLQRTLNDGPLGRTTLTAEIRQEGGSKGVLARVDLIGNYVVPERNVVKPEEISIRHTQDGSHGQRGNPPMEVNSPRSGMAQNARRRGAEPPEVDMQVDDGGAEDDDDDVSIMSLD